jgi:hypothetical protein
MEFGASHRNVRSAAVDQLACRHHFDRIRTNGRRDMAAALRERFEAPNKITMGGVRVPLVAMTTTLH